MRKPMALKDRLKEQRIKKKLSIEELAELVGVRSNTIQRIEDGITKNPLNITKYAEALECDALWLTDGINRHRIEETTQCYWCKEEILVNAIKCKHCSKYTNPTLGYLQMLILVLPVIALVLAMFQFNFSKQESSAATKKADEAAKAAETAKDADEKAKTSLEQTKELEESVQNSLREIYAVITKTAIANYLLSNDFSHGHLQILIESSPGDVIGEAMKEFARARSLNINKCPEIIYKADRKNIEKQAKLINYGVDERICHAYFFFESETVELDEE